MTNPKVAIIIVTYNGSEFIGACLSSLQNIGYPKDMFEIVIVDNASKDNTKELIQSGVQKLTTYNLQLTTIFRNENTGFAGGNNQGMKYAIENQFDYVYLLNQDTEVEPDFLKKTVEVAQSDEKIAAVQSRLMYADKKEMINSIGGMIHYLGYGFTKGNLESLKTYNLKLTTRDIAYPSGAGVLIHTNILKNVGLFNEEFFSYYEDADLGWRMWLAGYKIVMAPDSVVYHKYDFSRSVKSYYWMERNRYLMIFQNYKVATLVLLAPALFIIEVLTLTKSILNKRWMQRVKIYNYLIDLENWRKIVYNRKDIAKMRKISDKKMLKQFTGKLQYQENGGWVLKLVINPLLDIYFKFVKLIIFLVNMSKKIFITGVAGFLGSHLADRMLERGHTVVGCDSMIGGEKDNIPAGVDFHEVDCNDIEAMKELTKGCDTVYHCAAIATEGLSVFSPYTINKSIVDATISVGIGCVHNNVRRLVFCSSMARYGANKVPFTEDMQPAPEDPYGIAKVAAENYLQYMSDTFGLEIVIVAPHNIIGTRQKYDDPFRNVVSIMINLMLQGRQPIIYGDGEQKRSFSFVSDCIYCLEKCMTADVSGEVINIGPDKDEITINQLAKMLSDIIGFDLRPIHSPDRPNEVKNAYCSADKARKLLDYKPEKDLKDGLTEMVEWIKQKGTKPFEYHLPLEIVNEKTPRTWLDKKF